MKFLANSKAFTIYLVWFLSLLPLYVAKYNLFRPLEPGEEARPGIPSDFSPRMQEYTIYEGLLYLFIGIGLTFVFQFLLEKMRAQAYGRPKRMMLMFFGHVGYLTIFNLILFPLCSVIQVNLIGKSGAKQAILSTTILTFLILITWYGVYELMRMYQKDKKNKLEKAELKTNLKESQLNTLKGQINPHFMFNSLNNIRGLMLEDVDKSRDMITRLSEMLRYSLTQSKYDSIPVSDELEMIDNFIELSKIQFEDRLEYVEEIEDGYTEKQIPPMIIQLLVENALKHGISKLPDGGKVKLFVGEENRVFIIRVTNSGTLNYDESSTKLGLDNIRQRLDLQYGKEANFKLEEINNEVVATIKIP